MQLPTRMNETLMPLAAQATREVRAKASEMRAMAATATTQDVMSALLRLAERYDALAAAREAHQSPAIDAPDA